MGIRSKYTRHLVTYEVLKEREEADVTRLRTAVARHYPHYAAVIPERLLGGTQAVVLNYGTVAFKGTRNLSLPSNLARIREGFQCHEHLVANGEPFVPKIVHPLTDGWFYGMDFVGGSAPDLVRLSGLSTSQVRALAEDLASVMVATTKAFDTRTCKRLNLRAVQDDRVTPERVVRFDDDNVRQLRPHVTPEALDLILADWAVRSRLAAVGILNSCIRFAMRYHDLAFPQTMPVAGHSDLRDRNILVGENGRLSAVIDWGVCVKRPEFLFHGLALRGRPDFLTHLTDSYHQKGGQPVNAQHVTDLMKANILWRLYVMLHHPRHPEWKATTAPVYCDDLRHAFTLYPEPHDTRTCTRPACNSVPVRTQRRAPG